MAYFSDEVMIYYKVGVCLVVLVIAMSAITVQFGNHSGIQYTAWFKDTVNSLVDMAESSANRGDQDIDPSHKLMDYTTALTILDTLRSIVPDTELQNIANVNVQNFIQLLSDRRQRALASTTATAA
jgi:hypothetical protein